MLYTYVVTGFPEPDRLFAFSSLEAPSIVPYMPQ